MARRTRVFTVTAEGRDKGKKFLITEMPADKAERWALRAAFAIVNGGVQAPDGILDSGMAGIASMAHVAVWSLRSLQGLSYQAAGPLLDELMDCVQVLPDVEGVPPQPLYGGQNCQVEEVRTLLQLKVEAFQVHVDFSLADALRSFRTAPEAAAPSA